MKAYKKTFSNGVRLITIPLKDNPATTVMVFAGVGSNNEDKSNKGIAHFLEHMCFKGGAKYHSAFEVSTTLDAIGAENNAFTGNEFTGYYAKGNPKHFKKMLNVVGDIYLNATLPTEELEKERGVILEEINMYHDMPQRYVQDLFYQVLYGDQPAGWNTLGTKESVATMSREAFVAFKNKHYTAENTVVVVSGAMDKKLVEAEVKKMFSGMPRKKVIKRKKPKEVQKGSALLVEKRPTDQNHLILGLRAFDAGDKRTPALVVLSSVLGGGMSSRLFQKLREEMGVCYYVRSGIQTHDTHGSWAISAGVDTKRLEEVTSVLVGELRKLRDEVVDEKELSKVKEYLTGHLYLGLEDSLGVADFYFEQELLTGEMKTPQQWVKEIRAVTAQDVQKIARTLVRTDKLSMAVVGKIGDEKKLKKLLTFLPAGRQGRRYKI